MSAASKKKHNNAHKSFQSGVDQLEVSSLIAGAGNGRDVAQRLGSMTQTQSSQEQDGGFVDQPVGSGLIDEPIGSGLVEEGLPQASAIGNEGPVSAGNADTPSTPNNVDPKEVFDNSAQEGNKMSRIAQALLKPGELEAAMKGERPALDPTRESATPGYVPDFEKWVSNQEHIGTNVIAVVTRTPKESLFPQAFSESIKAIVELHACEIAGLTTGFYSLGDRSEQKSSEARLSATEKYGRPIDRLMHVWDKRWGDYLASQAKSVPASQAKDKIKIEDVTIDVMFIEADLSHMKVSTAWFGKNLRVSDYSGIESGRDIASPRPQTTYVSFTLQGKYERSDAVDERAQKVLDDLVASGLNPYERVPFVERVNMHE